LRSKEIRLAFLDQTLVAEEKEKIQTVIFALPLAILALIGLLFSSLRRRVYRR
jgi:hypothetical protein